MARTEKTERNNTIYKRYYNERLTLSQLAAIYGLAVTTIRTIVEKTDPGHKLIEERRKAAERADQERFIQERNAKVVELFVNTNMSIREIADQANVRLQGMQSLLRKVIPRPWPAHRITSRTHVNLSADKRAALEIKLQRLQNQVEAIKARLASGGDDVV